MDEPGSRLRASLGNDAGDWASRGDGETIQFGGLPIRWPFRQPRLPRGLLPGRRAPSRAAVKAALIPLAAGLLIGFGVGHFTARTSGKTAEAADGHGISSPLPRPLFVAQAIDATGERCAVQVGKNLELGVEIQNVSGDAVTLGQVIPEFPLGGLHTLASGLGACGALPTVNQLPPAPLIPEATEWIAGTFAVGVGCPEPLPVWFKVRYSLAGKHTATVIDAFPDLGSVPYRRCDTTQLNFSSPNVEIVDPATGSPYSG